MWRDLAIAVAANLAAGALLAMVGYYVVERRLRLREERERRVEVSLDVLEIVRDELEHDRRLATALRAHLPEGSLPYLGFEVGAWSLVSQVPAFTVLEPETAKALVAAYLRLRSANEQHALLFDFMYGPTGTLSYLIAGSTPEAKAMHGRLEERRADLRERLLRRVEELEPFVAAALERVEYELASARS